MSLPQPKSVFRENVLVASAFLLLVHLLYGRTVQAGLVTDFTGMQERLDGATFWGWLDSFGFPALHQVTNFFLYFFHKFFGTNGLPWHLVFTSMHVLNGVLGYHLGKKIFQRSGLDSPWLAAFSGSLLFLLSPYQAEVVVWKVCFNFLLSTASVLGSLLFLLDFFDKKRRSSLWWAHGLFAVGLFTFELALVVPVAGVILFFWWKVCPPPYPPQGGTTQPEATDLDTENLELQGELKSANLRKATMSPLGGGWGGTHLLMPPFFLLALYFGLNKVLFGGWVGHYGEATHLKFDIAQIASNCLKYFSKYLALWREWPGLLKQEWMGICESGMMAYGALALGVAIVLAGIFFFKKMNSWLRATWICWLLFFIALLPVANLYVPWLLHGENDRYGYLASLFFYLGLVALLHFLPKKIRYVLLVAAVLVSVFFLNKITTYWQQSAAVTNSLLDDFRWKNAPEVYVLAMPENLQGMPMFKDFSGEDLALGHALRYSKGKEVKGKIFQIAQFNLHTPTDGVSVLSDSTNHFKVKFDQWGNWWWRNGIGTGSYETERYEFKSVSRGSEIFVKNPAERAVFIYSKGGKWEEVQGFKVQGSKVQ